jgi:L-alanine-DL-glutamate epimerase-like enolase superfamily enzyme
LIEMLPPGGARNALDAALWDIEAKSGKGDPFSRTGSAPATVDSAVTLPMQGAEGLAKAVVDVAGANWIKVKVGREHVMETVRHVHEMAPRARLIVDPNQAWTSSELLDFAPKLASLGVALLEQPIPVGAESELGPQHRLIPLCADGACDGPQDLPRLAGRFEVINIKLDKIGGLTAALRLADAAEAIGMSLMVGCMLGPSLAIAPAMVLAQRCKFVDLDAPPFLAADSQPGFVFRNGRVEQPYLPALWG